MVGEPEITPVRPAHRFDEGALASFLDARLGGSAPLRVAQFEGGQSNPTYLLEPGGGRALRLREARQLLRAPDLALEPPVRRLEDGGDHLDGGADRVAARERPGFRRNRRRPRRLPDRELHPAPERTEDRGGARLGAL